MIARGRAVVLIMGLALVAEAAFAQQAARTLRRKKPPAEATQPAPRPTPLANPQERPLTELAEALGALAFLSQLCSPAADPNPWRARMETLLKAEGESSGAQEKMIGAFNAGFQDYSTTYRQCTDAARTAERVLTRDAARHARDIERRFGS